MGWFDRFAVQTSYQAGRRLTGILRYRELTDRYFGAFFKANLLTIFGFLPMGVGFLFVSGTGNPALVLAVFIAGGGIAAPFRWLSTIKAEFDSVFFPKEKGIEGEGE